MCPLTTPAQSLVQRDVELAGVKMSMQVLKLLPNGGYRVWIMLANRNDCHSSLMVSGVKKSLFCYFGTTWHANFRTTNMILPDFFYDGMPHQNNGIRWLLPCKIETTYVMIFRNSKPCISRLTYLVSILHGRLEARQYHFTFLKSDILLALLFYHKCPVL